MKTLSICLPNYNHGHYIAETIEAILNQSYKPTEIIICDDASTDNSVEIIEHYVKDNPQILFIRNENNLGVDLTVRKILGIATGEYVCFQSADDRILPGFFEKSMKLLGEYPQAGLCSTLTYIIDKEGENKGLYRWGGGFPTKECYLTSQTVRNRLIKNGSWLQGNTTIYRRDALEEAGGFRTELLFFCDAIALDIISLKYGVCFIPEPLACFRKMEGTYSMSGTNDPDTYFSAIDSVTGLIESTYKELFPHQYVTWWKKKQLLMLNLKAFSSAQKKQIDTLNRSKKRNGLFDKMLYEVLLSFMKIEYVLAIIYYCFYFRYSPLKNIRSNLSFSLRRIYMGL